MIAARFAPDTLRPVTIEPIAPVRLVRRDDGVWFADFGRAGFARPWLRLRSDAATTVSVHIGEVPTDETHIHPEPGGSRRYRAIEVAIPAGPSETLVTIPSDERNTGPLAIRMPAHIGEVLPFRYLELHGYDGPLTADDLRQVVAFYPFDETDATFESSSTVLNAVFDFCRYSMKATNFTGLFADGYRERIPYEADGLINQLGWYCTCPDPAPARATIEHLMHNGTWFQEWHQQLVMMAWEDYLQTGDDRLLRQYTARLGEKTLIALAREDGLIDSTSPAITHDLLDRLGLVQPHPKDDPAECLKAIVDWPHCGLFGLPPHMGETDHHEFRPINTVVNAFACHTMGLMSHICEAIGQTEQARQWADRARRTTEQFNRVLLDTRRGIYVDGEGSTHSSQHSNMFPMALGLVPPQYRASVIDFIESRGVACSVYGAHHLLEALYVAGRGEAARKLMACTGERSWAHMFRTTGSTISLEAWADRFKPNQDWNHAWGASPAAQIPRGLMGVRPARPGWAAATIRPQPGTLARAKLTIPTPQGPLTVSFRQKQGAFFRLEVDLPGEMTATVTLPPIGPGGGTLQSDTAGQVEQSGPGGHVLAGVTGRAVLDVRA
jgi:alpha-L-rhamnosidase